MTPDPVRAAGDAIRRSAAAHGCAVAVAVAQGEAVDWWSATFSGHRVALAVAASAGAPLDAWLAALPDLDLPLVDRFVADCAVDRVEATAAGVRVDLSILLLDAG